MRLLLSELGFEVTDLRRSLWQLAGWPLGTMEAQTGLHRGVLGMLRRLDPQLGLKTGV